ncbi:MAG: hypothetical protein NTZ13_03685 [Candidatus Parcubacteria bacterium]|nr:hypothetical protein [Candidatus Parcubacteria bacterium]
MGLTPFADPLCLYSSGGRATKQELNNIINESGKLLKAVEIDYKKNVMGNMRWTNEWINSDGKYHEYLFLMEKNKTKFLSPNLLKRESLLKV